MSDKSCTCTGFIANGERVRRVIDIAGLYTSSYEFDLFEFCPWCGKPLEEGEQEEQADFPAGIA